MTNYIGNKPADVPISVNDVPDLPASKITSGELANARVADLPTSKITSGTFADARISASSVTQHASTFDDNKINTNIALLGFKSAVNGSLIKYNLQDNIIDDFQDSSGIDTGASTNEQVTSGLVGGTVAFDGAETSISQGTGTAIGNMTGGGGIANAFNGTQHPAISSAATISSTSGHIGKNWGSNKSISKFRWHSTNNDGYSNDSNNASGMTLQLYGNSVNDFSSATAIGSAGSISNGRANSDSTTVTVDASGLFQYHWVQINAGTAALLACGELQFFEEALTTANNLTLISSATTAESAPSTSDLIILMEDQTGTATLNTDIKGYVSRDGGSNYTQVTLVDEGDFSGNTKIIVAHDVDISSQPSGTSMRYKITTHNQGVSKITKVDAVSFGWK